MDRFNLKFQGEILPGRDPAEVKKLFAREFFIDNPKRVEAFFSGREIILRRNLVKDDAAKVFVALRKIGVVTHIEKIEPELATQELPGQARPKQESPGQIGAEKDTARPSQPGRNNATGAPGAESVAKPPPTRPRPAAGAAPGPVATTQPQRAAPTGTATPVTGKLERPTPAPAQKPAQSAETPAAAARRDPPKPAPAQSPAANAPADTVVRRKRQPGAPNQFDLRQSNRSLRGLGRDENSAVLVRASIIAAAIALLAFLLVGLRFWSQSQAEIPRGLGLIAVDPRQQPVIQSGDQLLLHDRAGLSTYRVALADLDVQKLLGLDYFSNGDLVVLREAPPGALPGWLAALTGSDVQPGNSLLRCVLTARRCTTVADHIGPADFLVDRRNDEIYLADAGNDRLQKLDARGRVLASRELELSAPLYLRLQEGILYLTQAGSDSVLVLKPDEREFGLQLDAIALAVPNASQSGHIFPADLLYLNERWWTIMQSRDGSTAGLYQFTPRWKFETAVELPPGAVPTALTQWANKVLVTDSAQELIYRFDATAQQERDFSSEFLDLSLSEHRSQLSLAETLQAFVLVILFGASAGLLALGILQSMRGKVYTAPDDNADADFDINNDAIEWLDPAPQVQERLRQLGYGIAAMAVVLLLAAFVANLSVWSLFAIITLLAGLGGLYYALLRASGCHLGLLDDRLILVDHTNTYRVGSGPKIQYFKNYVMIDDVIVYLGNPVVEQFAHEPLQQKFQPLFNTGIKVDRATLRVKLIQSRHPMLLGVGGLAGALFFAAVLILLS